MKWSNLDVQGIKRRGRYTHDILSRYNFLKNEMQRFARLKLPLPPMLRTRLPEYRSLEASLRRQGLIK